MTVAGRYVSLVEGTAVASIWCVKDFPGLLIVVQKVKAQRVGGGQDVIQQMHSSSQVARLN